MAVLPFHGVFGSRLKMASANPRTRVEKSQQALLKRFIDDVQIIVLDKPHVFKTLCQMAHIMATNCRKRQAKAVLERDQDAEQTSS